MTVQALDFAKPFFEVSYVAAEPEIVVEDKSILLNLSETPISVREQHLGQLQSVMVADCGARDVQEAVVISGFDGKSDADTMAAIRETWPSAFEVRGEERLRGVEHYMSPKIWLKDRLGLTIYHSASVPLNVGLHKDHDFCPVPGFREVHTQIMGFGKMQQCKERDVATLYWEEHMAPGHTHRPMYDDKGNYPWHQFETTTPSVFMAVEMLPEGASPPK